LATIGTVTHAAATAPPFAGLGEHEARRRLDLFGLNRLVRNRRGARIREIARTFADPMALMLAAAAGAYALLGERTNAIVMAAAMVPVLGVDVILEARSRGALKRLAHASAPRARVVRDGIERPIETEHIVPGDVMLAGEGDVVAADGIVRWEANFSVDESSLTGESEPRAKTLAQPNIEPSEGNRVFAGCRVLTGHAYAEVTATGERSRHGNIARLVIESEHRPTPLQRKTAAMVRWMVAAAFVAASILFVVVLMRGGSFRKAFLSAISLAMSGVGEEFLLVLTLFLSLGAWRLGRIGVLVRRVAGVETLGATTVICLDKTGTLTAGSYALDVAQPFGATEHELLELAVLACERNPVDAMEAAIFSRAAQEGINPQVLQARWTLIRDHPFDPIGKHMSHVWEARDGGATRRVVAKGSLEGVLEHCDIVALARADAFAQNTRLASEGMRVLAVATRDSGVVDEATPTAFRAWDERDLRLVGLLGFRDPLRPEVPAAVAECQAAGITLKLITGDHALTAHAVAEAAGIAHRDEAIITGDALDRLTPDQFDAEARRCSIFARVRPEQKYALVDALSRAGEVVAMTGDGINDAPALKRADIGISMGSRATEVARATADLVLLRDDFSTLEATIREGRRLFANIQRAFRYLTGFKVMTVALALGAPLFGLPILLLPIDLVWLELIVHPVSALAFEDASGDKRAMRLPPRSPDAPVLRLNQALRSALSGVLLAAAALTLYTLRLDHGVAEARAIALAVAWAGSLFLIWAELAGEQAWWRVTLPRSTRFWIVIAVVAVSLPTMMAVPALSAILGIRTIPASGWIIAAIAAFACIAWRTVKPPRAGRA